MEWFPWLMGGFWAGVAVCIFVFWLRQPAVMKETRICDSDKQWMKLQHQMFLDQMERHRRRSEEKINRLRTRCHNLENGKEKT